MNSKPGLLTIRQAAEMCGVSRWTMAEWIHQGWIPVALFPKRRGGEPTNLRGARVDPADVERFIDRCKTRVGVFD